MKLRRHIDGGLELAPEVERERYPLGFFHSEAAKRERVFAWIEYDPDGGMRLVVSLTPNPNTVAAVPARP